MEAWGHVLNTPPGLEWLSEIQLPLDLAVDPRRW